MHHLSFSTATAIVGVFGFAAIITQAAAITTRTAQSSSNGCGSTIPKELTIGGPSYNFTNFASNSSATDPLRAYSVALPVDYNSNEPAPLIFSFHGRGENNGDQEQQSQFSDPEFNRKAIAVYPMGIDRQWQGDPAAPPTIKDMLFISELLSHLSSRYCVSPSQVYAAGKSNGGGFVGQLACDPLMSSRIAAFAAAPLAWYDDTATSSCNPSRANVPVLEMHGGKDTRIVYQGGPDKNRPGLTTEAIPQWLQQWAGRDHCDATNQTVPLEGVVGAGNAVNVTTWNCGGVQGLVQHYYSQQMQHVWPTTANAGFSGTDVMMKFFRRFGASK